MLPASMSTKRDDYRCVAKLHAQSIDQGFLSTLGPRFLALLYRAIDESPDSVLILAREDDQVVGFVAGTLDMGPVYRGLLRHWPALILSLAPSLLIPGRLWRMIEILRHTRRSKDRQAGQAAGTPALAAMPAAASAWPEAELLSIAVDPAFRGQGHAEALYAALKAFFASRGVESFRIVVGAPLAPAHRFYRRMGAVPAAEIAVHQGASSTVYMQTLNSPDDPA